jgi:hypothetical protein
MSRAIVPELKEAGGDVKYTEYAGGGHECARTLRDPKLTEWLLAQKRTADPSFVQAKVPVSAALIVRTLPDGMTGMWTGEGRTDAPGGRSVAHRRLPVSLEAREKCRARRC